MNGRTNACLHIGAEVYDWTRSKPNDHDAGWRVVIAITRPEDLGRFTDGANWRGSAAERCALHGGHARQRFDVKD